MKIGPAHFRDAALLIDPCGIEEMEKVVGLAFWMQRNSQWWAGDAVAFGEARFGDDIWQCVPNTLSERHLQRLLGQSKKIPPSERNPEVSWTHHSFVQKIKDPILRRSLLKQAEENGLSSDSFRRLVNQ